MDPQLAKRAVIQIKAVPSVYVSFIMLYGTYR